MRIYGKCNSCQNELKFSTDSRTRLEFKMEEGENKDFKCVNCGSKIKLHVDDLYAKESKLAHILAGLIFLLGTPLVILFVYPMISQSTNHYAIFVVGSLLLVPILVYGLIKRNEMVRVNSFNRLKLKGRTHNIKMNT